MMKVYGLVGHEVRSAHHHASSELYPTAAAARAMIPKWRAQMARDRVELENIKIQAFDFVDKPTVTFLEFRFYVDNVEYKATRHGDGERVIVYDMNTKTDVVSDKIRKLAAQILSAAEIAANE